MKSILVVEDTQDNFDLIADALEGRYEVWHAKTGPDGLDQALSLKPNLILLDMSLPELDGWEVAQRLRTVPAIAETPIIALTAHAMKGDRERCLQAGCTDYLSKPISVRELLKMVDHYAPVSTGQTA